MVRMAVRTGRARVPLHAPLRLAFVPQTPSFVPNRLSDVTPLHDRWPIASAGAPREQLAFHIEGGHRVTLVDEAG